MSAPTLTQKTLAVLGELLQDPGKPRYGLDIAEDAEIGSTTVYEVLMKLEQSGWVTSQWESVDPKNVGRPRRRLYRLTGAGERSARAAIETEIEKLQRTMGAKREVKTPPTSPFRRPKEALP